MSKNVSSVKQIDKQSEACQNTDKRVIYLTKIPNLSILPTQRHIPSMQSSSTPTDIFYHAEAE